VSVCRGTAIAHDAAVQVIDTSISARTAVKRGRSHSWARQETRTIVLRVTSRRPCDPAISFLARKNSGFRPSS